MIPRLVAVTPGDHGRGRDLRAWLPVLGEAGLPALLIREPDAPAREIAALAEEAARWIPFVVLHERCAGARSTGLPLHFRAGGPDPRPDVPFGISCHGGEAVDRALAAGASWAFLSPVWSPRSKPDDPRPTLGLDGYRAIAAGRPVLALGGVDAGRLAALRRAGGYGGAVMGAVFGGDPLHGARVVRELLAVFDDGT